MGGGVLSQVEDVGYQGGVLQAEDEDVDALHSRHCRHGLTASFRPEGFLEQFRVWLHSFEKQFLITTTVPDNEVLVRLEQVAGARVGNLVFA